MGHRYYDSRVGRFITQDPAHRGGNWYRYAGNDPIKMIDPGGLSEINAFAAPDGRNQGMLGGSTGSLMDFFANQDSWVFATPEQHIDAKHTAWDHYLDQTGTPMYVNANELPKPTLNDLLNNANVTGIIGNSTIGPGSCFPLNIDGIDLNFADLLIGRAVGHFEGNLTITGAYGADTTRYSIDGKMFVHPDTYQFYNNPDRGGLLNVITNATLVWGNINGGGVDFTVDVHGYVPVHLTGPPQ